MKTYPLYAMEYRDDTGDRIGFYSKGHHDPKEFLLAVGKEFDTDDVGMVLSLDDVKHRYFRNQMWGGGPVSDPWHELTIVKGPARGAYPVTFIDRWEYEEVEVEPEDDQGTIVTREMALDAGDETMEGMIWK